MGKIEYLPVFFGYLDSLDTLTDEQFGCVIRSALAYARDGVLPQLEGIELLAFSFLRGDIDRAKANYEAICEVNQANGRKGGRPRKTGETERLSENRTVSEKTEHNRKNPYKSNQNKTKQYPPSGEDVRARTREIGGSRAEDGEIYVPPVPTADEVRQYCSETGITLDASKFVNHYSAVGWLINGQRIRDWKALARRWAQEDAERAASQPQPVTSFDTDEFFAASLERSYGAPVQIPTKGTG